MNIEPLSNKPSKNYFSINVNKKIIVFFVVFIIVMTAWASFTRAGYIPNILGLEVLCSEKNQKKRLPAVRPQYRRASSTPSSVNGKTNPKEMLWEKPVLYLYPEKPTQVLVQLYYRGEVIADFPNYNHNINGWEVTAYPDGKIINKADNQEYSYIFWEGIPAELVEYDLSSGFIVRGEEVKIFLQEKLRQIGLTPKEYNEFIVYWYPKMMNNKYNLIHFSQKEYTNTAELIITPKPDSMLRVFMAYQALEEPVKITPQEFSVFERKGFTVVEWGGTEIK